MNTFWSNKTYETYKRDLTIQSSIAGKAYLAFGHIFQTNAQLTYYT